MAVMNGRLQLRFRYGVDSFLSWRFEGEEEGRLKMLDEG